jgi:hypothetical protein
MTTPKSNHRRYHLTPDRFFVALLTVQVFLFLSQWFQWLLGSTSGVLVE